jgi:hypothetical protein
MTQHWLPIASRGAVSEFMADPAFRCWKCAWPQAPEAAVTLTTPNIRLATSIQRARQGQRH